MAAASKANRTTQRLADQALIDGLVKHAAIVVALFIGGASVTAAQIIAKLSAHIAAMKATDVARAAWLAAVAAEKQLRTGDTPFIQSVKQMLLAMFSAQTDVLADFGLAPRKKPAISAETKVAAAAKARATRQARGTKSKKQLAAITGNVEGIVVTPVVIQRATPNATPAAPVTPAAPAVASK